MLTWHLRVQQVKAVVEWDDVRIVDGEPGLVCLSINALLSNDMDPKKTVGQHVEVPYGFLTSMVD